MITAESLAILEEMIRSYTGASGSPSLSQSRAGSSPSSTWLNNEGVPSNRCGFLNFLYDAYILRIFVVNQNLDTFTIETWTHDGDSINLQFLGSVSIPALRAVTFAVNYPLPYNKQVAFKIGTGSATNVVVGALETGRLNL